MLARQPLARQHFPITTRGTGPKVRCRASS
jgi:hypothetical protein